MPVFFLFTQRYTGRWQTKQKQTFDQIVLCLAGSRAKAVHAFMDIPPTCSVLAVNGSSIKHTKPRVKSGVSTAATVCTFHVVFLIFDFFLFFFTLLAFLVNSAVTEPFVNCMDGEKWKPDADEHILGKWYLIVKRFSAFAMLWEHFAAMPWMHLCLQRGCFKMIAKEHQRPWRPCCSRSNFRKVVHSVLSVYYFPIK